MLFHLPALVEHKFRRCLPAPLLLFFSQDFSRIFPCSFLLASLGRGFLFKSGCEELWNQFRNTCVNEGAALTFARRFFLKRRSTFKLCFPSRMLTAVFALGMAWHGVPNPLCPEGVLLCDILHWLHIQSIYGVMCEVRVVGVVVGWHVALARSPTVEITVKATKKTKKNKAQRLR